ncbi:MAG: hypothetical protein KGL39_48650 [Patescibacteria group bacterium]|nr:hypothetical protein [Patescibacteria group bacterium]
MTSESKIKRKEVIGDCTLYLGDCRDIIPTLEKVDAIVTDPPYGIGFKYESGREKAKTPQEYWEWYKPIHKAYMDKLKDGGFWAVWHSGTYHRFLWEWYGEETRIYIAAKNFVQLRPTAINYAYDPVAIGYKKGERPLRPFSPPRSLDYSIGNTAGVISDPTREEKGHPTPKPLDQLCHIVENFVLDGGTVLEPFMGSGTTGAACAKLGRKFIGCEIEPKYFDIACRRIEQSYKQPDFFRTRPQEQEAMDV